MKKIIAYPIFLFILFAANLTAQLPAETEATNDTVAVPLIMAAEDEFDDYTLLPRIMENSPNSAALGMYGKVPVGHYTGTPEINIPLHEIGIGGQSFPIGLSYHASGIRVAQDASWVGLGWSLNAGGCITRECIGGDDFNNSSSGIGFWYDVQLDAFLENNIGADLGGNGIDGIYFDHKRNPFPAPTATNSGIDSEPDIFSFNFGPYSGTMYFSKLRNKPKIRNCTDYLDVTYDVANDKWVIIDGYGFKYYFGESANSKETSVSYSHQYQSPLANPAKEGLSIKYPYDEVVNGWYLDRIEAPNGEKTTFTYKTEKVTTPISISQERRATVGPYITASGGVGYGMSIPADRTSYSYSYSSIRQCYLSTISYPNGQIVFTTSDRKDIQADNWTLPVDKNNQGKEAQKLDRITIRNNTRELKSYVFSYSYMGNQNDYNACRLMLNKVSIQNVSKSKTSHAYTFTYNGNALPIKHSLQTDYWGFYNNSLTPEECKAGTIMPTIIIPVMPHQQNGTHPERVMAGRDRTPNKDYMQCGILTQITYPTGGSTRFIYEPHSFTGGFHAATSWQTLKNEPSFFTFKETKGATGKSNYEIDINKTISFELKETSYVKFTVDITDYRQYYEPVYFQGGLRIGDLCLINENNPADDMFLSLPDMKKEGNTINRSNHREYFLPAGKYKVYMVPDPDPYRQSQCVNSNCQYYTTNSYFLDLKIQAVEEKWVTYGGGLRIKEIFDVNNNSQTNNYKKYNYESSYVSSGRLCVTPLYYKHYIASFTNPMGGVQEGTYNEYFADFMLIRSNPMIPLVQKCAGSPVAYTRVEEILGKNGEEGKTYYDFHYESDPALFWQSFLPASQYPGGHNFISATYTIIPDQVSFASEKNGSIRNKSIYDKDNRLIQYETYEYSSYRYPDEEVRGVSRYHIAPNLMEQGFPVDMYRSTNNMLFRTYYLNKIWWKLNKKTTIMYHHPGTTTREETYEYDGTNYKMTKTTTRDSHGWEMGTRILYPSSLTGSMATTMKNNHMVNLPVEKYIINNYFERQEGRTYYTETQGNILPAYTTYKTSGNPEEERLRFHRYDTRSNPVYITRDGTEKTVYIWSYNYQYPIIEVKNATYEEVRTALGYTTDAQVESLAAQTSPDVNTLSKKIREYFKEKPVLVSTFTYEPGVGRMTEKDPRGVVTTYEYDDFNRLKSIRDTRNKEVENYDYNFRNK